MLIHKIQPVLSPQFPESLKLDTADVTVYHGTVDKRCRHAPPCRSQPTKGAGTLRRAVRSQAHARILGGRHMECAYYFDFGRLCLPSVIAVGNRFVEGQRYCIKWMSDGDIQR
jgi:hypothetical protein